MPENKIEDPILELIKDKKSKKKVKWFGLEDNTLNKSVMVTAAAVVAFSLMLTGPGFLLVAAAAASIAYGALKGNDLKRENQSDFETLLKAYENIQKENLDLKNGQTNSLDNSKANTVENLDQQIQQLLRDREALRSALDSQASDTSTTQSTSNNSLESMTIASNSSLSTSSRSSGTTRSSRPANRPSMRNRGVRR
jgi:hypothetical protein